MSRQISGRYQRSSTRKVEGREIQQVVLSFLFIICFSYVYWSVLFKFHIYFILAVYCLLQLIWCILYCMCIIYDPKLYFICVFYICIYTIYDALLTCIRYYSNRTTVNMLSLMDLCWEFVWWWAKHQLIPMFLCGFYGILMCIYLGFYLLPVYFTYIYVFSTPSCICLSDVYI